MAVTFTDATFEDDVLKAEGLVLVDFWAAWCGPCIMLGPTIEEISEEMGTKVKVGKLNVDENQQTSFKYQVMSIPTVILFKDGEPVQTFIGVQPKQVYVDAIEKAGE
ncbi:thioredoxin [Candidatus Nomurabacteria bacterium]|nr:thioredoxin [Candidatus Nomurabacteria bacterium]MCB9803203.1 thioredoxin [Candidatus Nomurabacteria bacterium]